MSQGDRGGRSAERCRQHPVLGVTDQTPLLQGALAGVDEGFEAALGRAEARLSALRQGLGGALSAAGEELCAARERLAAAFGEAGAPGADLGPLASALEGQILWLYRRVRRRLDQALQQVAPGRRALAGLLDQLAGVYRRAAGEFPPSAVRVEARAPGAPRVDGRSLCEAFADELLGPRKSALASVWSARRVARRYRLVRVPARAVAVEVLSARPGGAGHPLGVSLGAAHSEAVSSVEGLWRGIRFNLEEALEEVRRFSAAPGEPEEGEALGARPERLALPEGACLGALDKARENLAVLGLPLDRFLAGVPAALREEHTALRGRLEGELARAGTRRARLRRWWRARAANLRRPWGRLRGVLAEGARGGSEAAGAAQGSVQRLLAAARALAGRQGPTPETLLQLTDLPPFSEIDQCLLDLPPAYCRLFHLGPLRTREFLVGREEELETLGEALERWRGGKAASVALIGPEGSGKTSLLNCFASEVGEEFLGVEVPRRVRSEAEVLTLVARWFGLEGPPESVEEVVTGIRSGPRRVVAVEGAHNLYLRVVGSRRVVETFFSVLMATRSHCLWVVSFRRYPWERLARLLRAGHYFTHEVRTVFHGEAEVRDALLLRHRSSGYPLVFGCEGAADARIQKLLACESADAEAVQRALEERFFRDLHATCGGNMQAALFCWLLSLRHVPEGNRVLVAPLPKLDFGFLKALDRDHRYALAELLGNGGLTPEEHAEIFAVDPVQGVLLLEHLVRFRVVEAEAAEAGRTARYSVNPVFSARVAEILESLNVL